ncbi:hypothetical protein ACFOON_14975 [Novosphingobium piscinae]|uniref:Glycosyltransferase RgtA/B/C/D-like domain-containing protein n=1 Tax=Novosphingobium piscinae TaxID=1507448 RepID=A0A7X1G189_9SPHN|nr:hypothetical protein [Novosphingobium piscinae]MBC2670644.1 hypothetical protein [Novosphingobium piscinae]
MSRTGGLALAAIPALVLLAVLWRPVWDVDIFWQLKLGELILARHGPLAGEPFAAHHLNEPLPAFAWLAQALLAQVRLWAGWGGLRLVSALCWTGAFVLAGRAAVARGVPRETAALALVGALLVSVPGASIRPQTLGLLAFGGLVWLVEWRGPAWRRVLAGAVILVLWQNLHPSVAVGAAWLGARAAWAWWRLWQADGEAAVRPPVVELTLLAGLAGLAQFATPDGIGFLRIATANGQISQALRVAEWLPLWAPENRVIAAVVMINALLVLVLAWRRRSGDGEQLWPWLMLLGLTLISARVMLFWAVALVPVLAAQLPRLQAPRLSRAAPLVLVAVTATAVLALRPTSFRETIPVTQLAQLRATGVKGTVFAHFPWGGAVIDRGYPDWRVAYDGRYYRYGLAEWNRYIAIGNGRPGLAELERVYHPAAYVLDREWTPGLIAELRARRDRWRELPGAGPAVIFIPAALPPG